MKTGMGNGLFLGRNAATVITWPPTVAPARVFDFRTDLGVTTSGGIITSVVDQTGNGHDLNSGIGPPLITNAFGTKPTMRFGGSHILNYTNETTCAGGFNTSYAFVASVPSGMGSSTISGFFGSYAGNCAMLRIGSTGGPDWGVSIATAYPDSGYSLAGNPLACVITYGASNADIWLYTDRNTPVHFTGGGANNWTNTAGSGRLGYSAAYATGDVYHLAQFNGVLSATEAATAITALKNTWGC